MYAYMLRGAADRANRAKRAAIVAALTGTRAAQVCADNEATSAVTNLEGVAYFVAAQLTG